MLSKKNEFAKQQQISDEVFKNLPVIASTTPEPESMLYKKKLITILPEQETRLQNLKEVLPYYVKGGYIHKQIREWAISNDIIKPGVKLYDMCAQIEEAVRRLTDFHPPENGLAFPCGCSLNSCAAHYSPLLGDDRILGTSDIMKIDYGVSVNGYVSDSAFSVCFDETFKPLINATIEATNEGIKMAGPDARMREIGARIEEIISSYTVDIAGHSYPLRPVQNLCGHQMDRFIIHCGKMIPIIKEPQNDNKMEYGEIYALETFATTGKGIVLDKGATSHFMVSPNPPKQKAGSQSDFLGFLQKNFSTMAFCQRMVEHAGQSQYTSTLNELIKRKAVVPYPPLCDIDTSYVSQHEHSFAILEDRKVIFTR